MLRWCEMTVLAVSPIAAARSGTDRPRAGVGRDILTRGQRQVVDPAE